MTTINDLIGLGVPWTVANRLGITPTAITASGAAAGSATQIGASQKLAYINASNSGSGVKLPQVGGDSGAMLGDMFVIANLLGAAINVYAAANSLGSAVTIYNRGSALAGTSGASLNSGYSTVFMPITVSTWVSFGGDA